MHSRLLALVATFAASTLLNVTAANARDLKHPWHFDLGAGLAMIQTTDSLETDKTGYDLMAKGAYAWQLGSVQLDWGFGFHQISASGEKHNIYQAYTQQSTFTDVQALFALGSSRYSVGPWLMLPVGRGSQLRYQDPDRLQASLLVGVNATARFPKESGDLLVSLGALTQPGIGGVTAFVVPLQVGWAFGTKPSAAPAAAATPAPIANEQLTVGSDILVFEIGEAKLRSRSGAYAKDVAHTLKEQDNQWERVEVRGFASSIESGVTAQERANAVRKALLEAGIDPNRVAASVGNASGDGDTQRVDIVVTTRGSKNAMAQTLGAIAEKYASFRLRDSALYFKVSSSELGPQAKTKIRALAQVLRSNPQAWTVISAYGFTDATGRAASNRILAKKRAEAVRKLLVDEGLPASKIEPIGMTSSKPATIPPTEEDRRAEIEIGGLKDPALLMKIQSAKGDAAK